MGGESNNYGFLFLLFFFYNLFSLESTINPLLSPPGGLFFSSTFEGGLNGEGGLKREEGLI